MTRIRPVLVRRVTVVGVATLLATVAPGAAAQDTTTKICLPTNPARCVPSGPVAPSRGSRPEAGQPYFEFMVDKPVREAAGTARPRYPDSLKVRGVQGEVLAQFVVDTTGSVEPATFKVLRSTHQLFADAVRSASPGMKYEPAEARGSKVRQLVQQPFVFAIAGSSEPVPRAPTPPPSARRAVTTVAPAPAQGTVKGWVFAQRMTIDSGNGRRPVVFTSRYAGTSGKARTEMEFDSLLSPGAPMVTIMDSATRTMTLVMRTPNMSMATVMAMPALPATRRRIVAVDTATQEDLGSGEPLLGHPTTLRRVVVTSSVAEFLGAMTCTRATNAEITLWRIADSTVSAVQRAMAVSLAGALGDFPDLTQAIERAPTRRMEGSVVRIASRQTSGTPGGAERVVTLMMDVIEARFADLDAALFAVPAGLQVMDTRGSDLQRAASDSMMKASMAASRERLFWRQHDSTATLPNGQKACVRTGSP